MLVLLLPLVSGPSWAELPVDIPDPNLRAAIENHLQVSDPTPTDMLDLINLTALSVKMPDLTGLEYASNLQTLRLRANDLSDVTPLGGLSNLDTLFLNDNFISDISPLGGLTNLTQLDLHHNEISDISALSNLVNVWFLALRENPVSDLSPLASMPRLAVLSLFRTPVSDISPLANLTTLRYVDLRDCPLNDEAYDVYLPQIRANNPGMTIELDLNRRTNADAVLHVRRVRGRAGRGGVPVPVPHARPPQRRSRSGLRVQPLDRCLPLHRQSH